MRYILAAIFVCAVGMPAASALPTLSPNSFSVLKATPIAHVVKRKRPHTHRHNRSGDGGIHPLVGSGDYKAGREAIGLRLRRGSSSSDTVAARRDR